MAWSRPSSRWLLPLLVATLLFAFGLRFHALDQQSFWNDEGNSARLSERTPALIIEGTASDIHPPLYYLLLRGWREGVGETEFGLRALSAFAGVLTVALVAALGRQLGSRRPALLISLSALLAALNPALIYYGQEARMYALLGLLAALSTWCLLNWRRRLSAEEAGPRSPAALPWAAAYVLCAAAGLYTHYFFLAVLLAHNLLVLGWLVMGARLSSPTGRRWRLDGRLLLNWVVMMVLTGVLYAPWIGTFLEQFGVDDLGARGWLPTYLWRALAWLAFGATVEVTMLAGAILLVAIVLLLGIIFGGKRVLVAALCLFVPVFLLYAAGTVQPAFLKFLLVAVPFFCLLLAAAVSEGERRWQQALPAGLLLLALPLGTARSLNNYFNEPSYARADYRGMAALIAADEREAVGVILNGPNQWEVFTYYFADETAVFPLPRGRSRPDPAEMAAALNEIASAHSRLYALFWGDGQRDPERLIESWLDTNAYRAADEWYGDVRLVTYAVPGVPAAAPTAALAAPFGESIVLEGFAATDEPLRPGDIVQTTLFWRTDAPLGERYKVFLHLLAADGTLVAQRDSEPGGGAKLTVDWPAGETVSDNHGILLPADLTPGDYRLAVGLYELLDPAARLTLGTEGQDDSLQLFTVTVVSE